MNKLFIAGLIGLVMAPSLSFAQVVEVPKETDLASALRTQIEALTIQLLLAQIAALQEQIAALIAAQKTPTQRTQEIKTAAVLEQFGEAAVEIDLSKTNLNTGSIQCLAGRYSLPVHILGTWGYVLATMDSDNTHLAKSYTNTGKTLELKANWDIQSNNAETLEVGREFQYDIKVYDGPILSSRGTPVNRFLLSEDSGNLTLPNCQQ